jgi:transposase
LSSLRRRCTGEKRGQSKQALGRSRGGFSTKIHLIVDGLGNPLDFQLTGGERHDVSQAPALLLAASAERNLSYVIADRGYDAQEFLQLIDSLGAIAVIPPRKNRRSARIYDSHLYKERHLVECTINKLKYYRRIFSRFEKLASRFLGFLSLAASLIWLR